MLDIKFITENRTVVEKALRDKKADAVDLDRIIELAAKRSELRGKISLTNEARNAAAKSRDIDRGRALKAESSALDDSLKEVEKDFVGLMIKVPNVPSADTPVGDESASKELRTSGEVQAFPFPAKDHVELGESLGLIDNERAARVAGARFTYLKGDLALLQFALVNLAFSVLTDESALDRIASAAGLSVSTKAFTPVVPPVMIEPAVLNRMGRLEPREDRYFIEKDSLFLAGSAEHTLGPMHMDETFSESDLPVRYVGYSTCFRREAGTYGKDTRGILRMHQFDKIEMETFTLPEASYAEQDFLVAIQEHLLSALNIPYRVIIVATGDMGFPDHRQIDIECFMPGLDAGKGVRGMYRETHSADLIAGFQPRRLNTRVKRSNGKLEHVHMNDATAFAIGRTLIAIMENYQDADGSIRIPDVLVKYMGKDRITRS